MPYQLWDSIKMPEGYHIQVLTAKRRAIFATIVTACTGKAGSGAGSARSNPVGERLFRFGEQQ
jgi:hypothetical protein